MRLRNICINKSGFTLLEVLITLSIIGLIAGFSVIAGISSYRHSVFQDHENAIVDLLHQARSQSLAGIGGSNHGVYFDTHHAVLFRGDSFATRDSAFDELVNVGTETHLSG